MTAKKPDEPPVGLALLRAPFPPNQVSTLPKPYKKDSPKGKCQDCGGYHGLPAVHLSYVGHAALTDRLLDADPEWNWEPMGYNPDGTPALDGNGGLWIKLTVCGVTRPGYGSADGKRGGDAMKEIIGDALRNAAMRFGAALDLWHKGDLHADEDDEVTHDVAPPGLNGDQLTKLQNLIKATSSNEIALLKHFGAPPNTLLKDMPLPVFEDAIAMLEKKLEKLAKQDTAAKAAAQEPADTGRQNSNWNKDLDDEIPF